MQRIESLLRKEIGLDAASIGSSAIERTVQLRIKNLGLKSVGDYAQLLHSSRGELDELIEAVVVLETWFFRDRDPFNAFVELALERLEQNPGGEVSGANGQVSGPDTPHMIPRPSLRVLSVPCSTGEEAYSLAMALLDANAPPDRYVINAVDVSANALARARKGVYGKNSFRGKELAFRDRHFQKVSSARCQVSGEPETPHLTPRASYVNQDLTPGTSHHAPLYVLNPRVRECVQFFRDNILDDEFLLGHTPYDFIFCRNLLIYFDRDTQVRALQKLHLLLAPQGVLFVGPAELPLVLRPSPRHAVRGASDPVSGEPDTSHLTPGTPYNGFVNAHLAKAFACRKAAWAPVGSRESGVESQSQPPTLDSRPTRATFHPALRDQFPLSASPPSDLDAARQLADAGNLEEAVMVCQAHLRQQGPSAQAYYLMGLVRDAGGDPQAIEYYRKALYLEPNHYETLLQMSLLLEKMGDPVAASIFKRRASRIAGQQTI